MALNFLYQIDPNTMLLGSFFIIALMFFLWTLGRVIKDNNAIKTIISFTLALLSTWGLNRANFDLSGIIYSIGFSEEAIYLLAPILFLGFLFIIGLKKDKTTQKRKFSLSRMLIVLGILMIASSIFGLVYQKDVVLYTGIILLVIGLVLAQRSKKKINLNQKQTQGDIYPKNNSNAPNTHQLRQQGLAALTQAAQNFKRWAKSQKNPKMVGSWTMFINYLKQNNWGRNEREICERLYISKKDFVNVFNRYGKV